MKRLGVITLGFGVEGCGHPSPGDLELLASVALGVPLLFILALLRASLLRMARRRAQPVEGQGAPPASGGLRSKAWAGLTIALALSSAVAMHVWVVTPGDILALPAGAPFYVGCFFQVSCALLELDVIVRAARSLRSAPARSATAS